MKMARICSKDGSALVESAIAYPIIALAVICLIQILVALYQIVAIKAGCDLVACRQAGKISGTFKTVEHINSNHAVETSIIKDGFYREVLAEQQYKTKSDRFGFKDSDRTEESCCHAVDESRIIRNIDLTADGIMAVADMLTENRKDME